MTNADAALRRTRTANGSFAPISEDLRERVAQLETRLAIVEQKTCLMKGISIPANIERWFRIHHYLSTMQFTFELRAIEPSYSEGAIRTTLYRACREGRLLRIRDGLYEEAY